MPDKVDVFLTKTPPYDVVMTIKCYNPDMQNQMFGLLVAAIQLADYEKHQDALTHLPKSKRESYARRHGLDPRH